MEEQLLTKNDNISLNLSAILNAWKNVSQIKLDNYKIQENFGYIHNYSETTREFNNSIIGFGAKQGKPILLLSVKETNGFIFKFGDDKKYSNIEKINEKILNIKNIGCILYFFDLEKNRISNNEIEVMKFLRFGFNNTNNNDFWNKIIIVFYNAEKVKNTFFGTQLVYNPPKSQKENYDTQYVKRCKEAITKFNEHILKRKETLKRNIQRMCKNYFVLETCKFKSIIIGNGIKEINSDDESFNIPYGISTKCENDLSKIIENNNLYKNWYTSLIRLVNDTVETKRINCEIVNTQDIKIKINEGYNIGTKLKRSYKLITMWFVTILCLNILIGFSTNNFNNRLYLTIPVCGVFDMIAFYYRKQIVQIIYPCLYKYIKNDTEYQWLFA